MSISSSIGPISGIDYGKLIDGLTALDQQPIDNLRTRITTLDSQNNAFTSLTALMTGLKVSSASFATSAIFRAATATSSNQGVLTAVAGVGTPVGSYQMTVQRLAAASQVASQGFSNTTTPLGLSGALTFGFGGGTLQQPEKLADLNGGKGVSRGSIRITDRSGNAAVVDLTKAVDVNDVVDAINNSTGVNVQASIQGDKFVLTDRSGGGGNFTISDLGAATTATDLGLAQSVTSSTLTGGDANKLNLTSNLNSLHNGTGLRTAGILSDFSITGTTGIANISLSGAKTLGDVLAKINTQTGATGVTAAISTDGHGITLTDSGGATPAVAALNGSLAAQDLGLTAGTTGAGTLTGTRINAGLNSSLLSDLRGGQGIGVGTIHITSRAGGAGTDVNLSTAKTVGDVITAINGAGAGVTASLNNAGTALVLTDTTGAASGTLSVTDVSGTGAADLGILQSVSAASINSGDLHRRTVSNNTALSSLNAGAGFSAGKIKLTDSSGASTTVDLTGSTIVTVGDVITQINNTGSKIKASLNANGNGILLTDTAGGTLTAKTEEVNGGTTAASLGFANNFTGTTDDGSQQKSVTIGTNDTLNDIVSKINSANVGVSAQIISDGSDTPYRLTLVSKNSGAAGNLIFNGDAAGISSTTLVQGQDAVVQYGTGAGTISATSSTNTLSNLIPSLTVTLQGTGTANITVGRDSSKVSDAISGFVDSYNKVFDAISDLTRFDPNDSTNRGVLFGDSTIQTVQQSLGSFLTNVYSNVGPLKTLSAVGITVGQDGRLTLDSDKLASILASNLDDVRTLFTTNTKAAPPFSQGSFKITDKNGKTGTVVLGANQQSINDVIAAINQANTGITASSLSNGFGVVLTDNSGGTGTASVVDLNGGSAALSLGLTGTFTGPSNTVLAGTALKSAATTTAVEGIGATLSDLLDKFVNGQTGLIFKTTDDITTSEQQLTDRVSSLNDLLAAKKNRLILQFANLETTIASLQNQGKALSSFTSPTASK